MNPIVDEVKGDYGRKVKFEFVNMDDKSGKDKATEYGVIGYPNILILDSAGEEFSLLKGVVPKPSIEKALDGVLAKEEN
jgi:thioredoxin-related protein